MAAKTVSLLDALFNAAVSTAKSDDVLRLAFVAAGGNQDEPKRILLAARISHSLKVTREVALLTLAKTGNPKHNPTHGDDVRSIAEEKAYGAARGYLTACLKRWGLQTTATQGGDRTKDAKSMDTEKLVSPKFKVTDAVELMAWSKAHASQGYDFFLLNKAHPALQDDVSAQLMGAFADHLDAIKAIIAKAGK